MSYRPSPQQSRPTPARLRNPFRQPGTRKAIVPGSSSAPAAGADLLPSSSSHARHAQDGSPRVVKAAKMASSSSSSSKKVDKGREVVVVRSAESSPGSSPESSPLTCPAAAWLTSSQARRPVGSPAAQGGGSAPRRRKPHPPPPPTSITVSTLGEPFSWLAGPSEYMRLLPPSERSLPDDAPAVGRRPSPAAASMSGTSVGFSRHQPVNLGSSDGLFSANDDDDDYITDEDSSAVAHRSPAGSGSRSRRHRSHSLSSSHPGTPPALPTLLEEPDEEELAAEGQLAPLRSAAC